MCGDEKKQTLRSCEVFYHSHVMSRCLKRRLLSKPAFPPDGDAPVVFLAPSPSSVLFLYMGGALHRPTGPALPT